MRQSGHDAPRKLCIDISIGAAFKQVIAYSQEEQFFGRLERGWIAELGDVAGAGVEGAQIGHGGPEQLNGGDGEGGGDVREEGDGQTVEDLGGGVGVRLGDFVV